jgi:fatty acid desaturase
MLCKYKEALGVPGKGIHQYRIFNVAIMDVLLTIIVAGILAWIFKLNFWLLLLILFLLGIILHRLFCVRTTVDKLLFKYPAS